MLVQGFIDMVGHTLTGSHSDKITVLGGAKPPVSDIRAGSPSYESTGSASKNYTSSVNVQSYAKYILLGTSDTPAKSTDCTLTSVESCAKGVVAWSRNKVIVTGTYTNTASETKIFKEIGLTTMCTSSSTFLSILLTRSVFPEPVVIPAGESKSFTITIDFNKFADTVVTA